MPLFIRFEVEAWGALKYKRKIKIESEALEGVTLQELLIEMEELAQCAKDFVSNDKVAAGMEEANGG